MPFERFADPSKMIRYPNLPAPAFPPQLEPIAEETPKMYPVLVGEEDEKKMYVNRAIPPQIFDNTDENFTAEDWLNNVDMVASANNWPSDQVMKIAPCYLKKGPQIWYLAYQSAAYTKHRKLDWDLFKKDLLQAYPKGTAPTLLRQERMNRKLKPNEPIEQYVADIIRMSVKINRDVTEDDMLGYIFDGLPANLFEKLHPLNIKTLKDFREKAKVYTEAAEIATARTENNFSMVDFRRAIEDCFTTSNVYNPKSSNNNPADQKKVNFQNPNMNSFNRNNSNRNFSNRGRNNRFQNRPFNRNNVNRYNPPNNVRPHMNRSNYQRQMTCYNCGKPGHMSSQCFQPKKNYYASPSAPTLN